MIVALHIRALRGSMGWRATAFRGDIAVGVGTSALCGTAASRRACCAAMGLAKDRAPFLSLKPNHDGTTYTVVDTPVQTDDPDFDMVNVTRPRTRP